ncbi:MAG: hypothetical protein IPH58_05415 [Sphingobacteriales bacterium]|nr:hypothetical protein [Sphingobacteriales bacterium]
MKIIDNILYLEGSEFVKTAKNTDGLVPKDSYSKLRQRGKVDVLGSGGNGREVLIKYDNLPPVYKDLVWEKYGDPYQYAAKQPIIDLIKPDTQAVKFFETEDVAPLSYEDQRCYANDAAILKAFHLLLSDKKKLKASMQISLASFWDMACELVSDLSHRFPNTLPTSLRRLKPKYNDFVNSGFDYNVLIDRRKYNETNNKIADERLEWLIMSLYVQQYRPYKKEVYNDYLSFLNGKKKVVDAHSGEVLNPEDFKEYGRLSDATVWRILNKPANLLTVEKMRLNALDYSNKHLPYNERYAPQYSLSKLSMDDYEPPFLMPNGNRVSGYVVVDVASKCIVGKAFSRDKNTDLLVNSLKDMFRVLVNKGCGMPGEIEFERHLTDSLMKEDGLLKAGVLFPFVRLCRAANPREKRAEHVFRQYKYTKKKEKGWRGRPFARNEANRLNENVNAKRDYDEILAIETAYITRWNNSLHEDQEKYKGMTRMEVFLKNQHPGLPKLKRAHLARYIGEKTNTTIRNNKMVQVQYNSYWLPDADSVFLFDSYSVTAYWLPDDEGVKEVYLYQNDKYVCTAKRSTPYNEAQWEQTDEDVRSMHEQFGYRSRFDAIVRERVSGLARLKVVYDDGSNDYELPAPKPATSLLTVDVESEKPQRRNISQMAEDDL